MRIDFTNQKSSRRFYRNAQAGFRIKQQVKSYSEEEK